MNYLQIWLIESYIKSLNYLTGITDNMSEKPLTSEDFEKLVEKSSAVLSENLPTVLKSVYSQTLSNISQLVAKNSTFYLSIVVLFIFVILYCYFVYLCSVPEKMKNKVIMTIRLLSIIPPRIIADTPSIRNSLNSSSI